MIAKPLEYLNEQLVAWIRYKSKSKLSQIENNVSIFVHVPIYVPFDPKDDMDAFHAYSLIKDPTSTYIDGLACNASCLI